MNGNLCSSSVRPGSTVLMLQRSTPSTSPMWSAASPHSVAAVPWALLRPARHVFPAHRDTTWSMGQECVSGAHHTPSSDLSSQLERQLAFSVDQTQRQTRFGGQNHVTCRITLSYVNSTLPNSQFNSPSTRRTQRVSVNARWTCRQEMEQSCTMTSLVWPMPRASTAARASPAKAWDISIASMWLSVGKRWGAVVLIWTFHLLHANPPFVRCRDGCRLPVWTTWQIVGERSKVMSASPQWFPLTSEARAWCHHSLS